MNKRHKSGNSGTAQKISQTLANLADPTQAEQAQRFFKTAPGDYGAGDCFYGIRVPELRKLAKAFSELSLRETEKLLKSPYHEARLVALIILVNQFQHGDEKQRQVIFDSYLGNRCYINNWDLVDVSADKIVGPMLISRERDLLYTLARSESVWDRRIAIMATFHFIKHGEFDETLKLAALLLDDDHDLIHKAVGWMLREIGKRDQKREECFLLEHYRLMPRTMLRYAIEKFEESRRQRYLRGEI